MQFSTVDLVGATTIAAVLVAGAISLWTTPIAAPWLIIPAVAAIPILISWRRNQRHEIKNPLPVGSSLVVAVSIWSIAIIAVTQYGILNGGTGPIQYANTVSARQIFSLRTFTVLVLFFTPILCLASLTAFRVFRIRIHQAGTMIAIPFFVFAVLCLLAHPRFFPMA